MTALLTGMAQLNHNSPIPLHFQVEQIIRDMITQPRYQNGDLLPNEVALAKQWGIARNTLRQATNKLVQEGLLTRKKGVGTRVAERHITTNLASWHSFTQEMNQQGVPFTNLLIRVGYTAADERISAFFGLAPQTNVLQLERIKGVDRQPVVYFVSFFHPRIGLTGEEDFTRPLYDILEHDYSTVPYTSREEIEATTATAELAARLDLPADAPVLLRRRRVLDAGGRPIEYNLGYYNAKRFTYKIEINQVPPASSSA